jgi:hypothetical protein
MALNYVLTGCNLDGIDDRIVSAMIWTSMPVMLDTVELKNLSEWRFRLFALDELYPDAKYADELIPLLERFVGMRTNVVSEPRSKFIRNCGRIVEERAAVAVTRRDRQMAQQRGDVK